MSESKFGEPWQKGHWSGQCPTKSDGVIACQAMDVATAERIIACVNFCAGIEVEALTLLNQSGHPTLSQICEENQKLRQQTIFKENNKMIKELKIEISDEDWAFVKSEVERLKHEENADVTEDSVVSTLVETGIQREAAVVEASL